MNVAIYKDALLKKRVGARADRRSQAAPDLDGAQQRPPGRHGRSGLRQQRSSHPAAAEADRRQDPAGDRRSADADRKGHLRHLPRLRRADRRSPAERHSLDARLHHLQGKAEGVTPTELLADLHPRLSISSGGAADAARRRRARIVTDYDVNNAYQYIIAREETHLSWLQHALLDLGAPLPHDPPRGAVPTRKGDGVEVARRRRCARPMRSSSRNGATAIDDGDQRPPPGHAARSSSARCSSTSGCSSRPPRAAQDLIGTSLAINDHRGDGDGARRWTGDLDRGRDRARQQPRRSRSAPRLRRRAPARPPHRISVNPAGTTRRRSACRADQPRYLNGVVVGDTRSDARASCSIGCCAIERAAGRDAAIAVAPRTLDLDLILFGDAADRGGRAGGAASAIPRAALRARAARGSGAGLDRPGQRGQDGQCAASSRRGGRRGPS